MNAPVLFLGPAGTHSHEAALQRFGPKAKLVPCLSHYEIFARLCAGRSQPLPIAIVPVENSIEGPVTQTLDQLARHPKATILDSFSMPLRQHLMARPGVRLATLRRVYSHPQALGQCRATLDHLMPRAERIPESSTAAAARRAAQDPESAAIASDAAAQLHRLAILRKNVQDGDESVTRFFTLTAGRTTSRSRPGAERRTLMYLVIGNRPGALLHMLAPFDAADINLTFIQSRPLPGRPWEYAFFIEAATAWKSAPARAAWKLVLALSESGWIIGTYPVG